MNRFGESILSEYELFEYCFTEIHPKYPETSENDPDVYRATFVWSWNGYSGFGEIDFYKSQKCLCNIYGENTSNMTVSSSSKRQQPNGRGNCALYNDPSLAELFSKMLRSIA